VKKGGGVDSRAEEKTNAKPIENSLKSINPGETRWKTNKEKKKSNQGVANSRQGRRGKKGARIGTPTRKGVKKDQDILSEQKGRGMQTKSKKGS